MSQGSTLSPLSHTAYGSSLSPPSPSFLPPSPSCSPSSSSSPRGYTISPVLPVSPVMMEKKGRRRGLYFPNHSDVDKRGDEIKGALGDLCDNFFLGDDDPSTSLRATDLKGDSFGFREEQEEDRGRSMRGGFSDFDEWEGEERLLGRLGRRGERESLDGFRAKRIRGGLFGGEVEEEERERERETETEREMDKGKEEMDDVIMSHEEEDEVLEEEEEEEELGFSREGIEESSPRSRRGRSMSGLKEKMKKSPLFRSMNWK